MKKILLTAFMDTSAERLMEGTTYPVLLLPNDKVKDSEKLIATISNGKIDYIISFGQRPNIKNKVHIETFAKKGDIHIHTEFECDKLKGLFVENGINAKISHNAGNSYCNELYFHGLKYIWENKVDVKMVFVHIPFEKNIDDFEEFRKRIFDILEEIRLGEHSG